MPRIIFLDHGGVLDDILENPTADDIVLVPGEWEDGFRYPSRALPAGKKIVAILKDLCENYDCRIAFYSGNKWQEQAELLQLLKAHGFPVDKVVAAAVSDPTAYPGVSSQSPIIEMKENITVASFGNCDKNGKANLREALSLPELLNINKSERHLHCVFDDGPPNVSTALDEGYLAYRIGSNRADSEHLTDQYGGKFLHVVSGSCHHPYKIGSLVDCLEDFALVVRSEYQNHNNADKDFFSIDKYSLDNNAGKLPIGPSDDLNNNNGYKEIPVVKIDSRPYLTNDSIKSPDYFEAVSQQANKCPQKFSADLLDELANKKKDVVQDAENTLSLNDNPLQGKKNRKEAERLKNVVQRLKPEQCSVGQMIKTPGYVKFKDQDYYKVSSVVLADLAPAEVATALREAVLQIGAFCAEQCQDYGTTLVVAIVRGSGIYTASVGNSNVVLVTENDQNAWEGRLLHKIHSSSIPEESQRFKDLGGVMVAGDGNKVKEGLALTRSIGDAGIKGISYDPEISHFVLPKEGNTYHHARVLLYSDGVSDVLSEKEVAQLVGTHARTAKANLASIICKRALERNSVDNISVVVSCPLPYTVKSGQCPVYIVLDGHDAIEHDYTDPTAKFVKTIGDTFPNVLQQQIDKMLFLRNQINEAQRLIEHKEDLYRKNGKGWFWDKKTDHLLNEIDALTELKVRLEGFKMTGNYYQFDEKIRDVIAEAKKTKTHTGFTKQSGAPGRGKVVKFCEALQQGADELAARDVFRPAPPKNNNNNNNN